MSEASIFCLTQHLFSFLDDRINAMRYSSIQISKVDLEEKVLGIRTRNLMFASLAFVNDF